MSRCGRHCGHHRRGLHRSGRKRSRSRNRTERLVVRAGRIAAYILLAWATAHFWNRPITTELLLFVAWGALELYAACALEAGGTLGLTATWCLVAIIFCVFALSLTCYVLYYRLTATPSFVAGALPLSAVGIFSTILPLLL